MACGNGVPPLLLPWTNVSVTKDGNAISRGIEISVGTPNQIVSLRPTIADYNVFLFNQADCKSESNDSCIGYDGGTYDSGKSSTFYLTTQARWNGTYNALEQSSGSFIYFNDVIDFGQNGTVYGFPMFMDQPGNGNAFSVSTCANFKLIHRQHSRPIGPPFGSGLQLSESCCEFKCCAFAGVGLVDRDQKYLEPY
jgi:hypothetical protein